jgi:hypothetical protein
MRIHWVYVSLALFLLLGLDGEAQLRSNVVGSPHYCRDELGQIEISYEVRNAFTNDSAKSLVVRLGLPRVLSFFLFSEQERIDAASAVYQSSQDSAGPPPFKRKRLKPKESVEWNTEATIMIDGQGSSSRLPKPGDYFLLPFQISRWKVITIPSAKALIGAACFPLRSRNLILIRRSVIDLNDGRPMPKSVQAALRGGPAVSGNPQFRVWVSIPKSALPRHRV